MEHPLSMPNFIASAHLFPDGFFMQKHVPVVMGHTHNHNHVEVILPVGCAVYFDTHAGPAVANDTELCLLWGQLPHRVTQIEGDGYVYVANLPLPEILSLDLPELVTKALVSGELISALSANQRDPVMFEGWVTDYESGHQMKMALARTELQCRLRRQCLAGWHPLTERLADEPSKTVGKSAKTSDKQIKRVQQMIRFMAEHYTQPITIADITQAASVSEGYGMGVFQKTIGMSVTAYLSKLRLYHAKTALIGSYEKIVTIAMDSGFGSVSRFYEVFAKETGQTPQSFRASHNL